MKKDRKKLRLGKETVRVLGRDQLAQAAGASIYFCASAYLKCTAKCGTGGVSQTTCLTCDSKTCPTETDGP
jgi:hypothetical protein